MASVSVRELGVAFGNLKVLDGPRPRRRGRRVHRAARPLRLRQVHAAQRHRRPARHRRRADLDRRAQRHLGGAEGPRHRHGVPVLRALSAHDGRKGTCPSACKMPRVPKRGDRAARRRGRASCCRSSRCWTGGRRSSPAASASASPSAARWCATSTCSCSTSRCPTSTPSCAPSCASRSSGCTSGSAAPR